MARDPTFLGTVQDVTGARVHVALDEQTLSGLTFLAGHAYRIGQLGAFARIQLGYLDLFGIVSQVGAGAVPERLVDERPHGDRWMTVQLVGQARRDSFFERGIAQYPTIGDRVHLVAEEDLRRIYGRPEHPRYLRVGSLAAAPSIPALVDVERLITRHSAVVGATGSGKSTTVAGLLNAICDEDRYPSARVILIDVHGEYARALGDRANVFRIGANQVRGEQELSLPYWALNFDELSRVALGSLDEPARAAFIDKISDLKREALMEAPRTGVSEDTVTVDTPVPFSIHQLWWDFWTETKATHHEKKDTPQSSATWALELDGNGKPVQAGSALDVVPPRFRPIKNAAGDNEKIRLSSSTLKLGRSLDVLTGRLRDKRLDFLFRPGPWSYEKAVDPKADLDDLLQSWIGSPKPATILDLSGVPNSIQSEVVAAFLRIIYEAIFWARNLPEGGRARPLLIILEEAHVYLGGKEPAAASSVERIAKEGRKYGVGLMIVSQRPSEISPTILSQCGTLIALRLSNSSDRSHVTGTVNDSLEGLLAMLPILRTGEAIILGEGVTLPLRAMISKPPQDRRPDSQDPQIVADPTLVESEAEYGWTSKRPVSDYSQVLAVWRSQSTVLSKGGEGKVGLEFRRIRKYQ